MTLWKAALLCLLPFLSGRSLVAGVLLLSASLASGAAPWWMIDAAGAIIFASFRQWQGRAIAGLFFAMLVADLASGDAWLIGIWAGWIQLAIVMLWAGSDWKPQRTARVT